MDSFLREPPMSASKNGSCEHGSPLVPPNVWAFTILATHCYAWSRVSGGEPLAQVWSGGDQNAFQTTGCQVPFLNRWEELDLRYVLEIVVATFGKVGRGRISRETTQELWMVILPRLDGRLQRPTRWHMIHGSALSWRVDGNSCAARLLHHRKNCNEGHSARKSWMIKQYETMCVYFFIHWFTLCIYIYMYMIYQLEGYSV